MKVLVDTPVWSYAFRSTRENFQNDINRLKSLISDQRALLLGPIRQEILSGYSDMKKFNQLKEKLSFFQNTPIQDGDYELAAEFSNTCRKKGIQGSHTDFLICAVSKRLEAPVFTTDKDFLHYQKVLSFKLY